MVSVSDQLIERQIEDNSAKPRSFLVVLLNRWHLLENASREMLPV
jgi:hypothetical protein